MSDTQIIRPRLAFEREFGQHRNWWVRGSELSGNAVKVLLHLLTHDPHYPITQTEARKQLGLGESAWRAAKENLMQYGFLIEIRDRYPQGARRANGKPCGGQNRYRLLLQDPAEGTFVNLDDAIIESSEPINVEDEMPDRAGSRKSRPVNETALDNQERLEKPLISGHVKIKTGSKTALDNQDPFIGREEDRDYGLDIYKSQSQSSSITRAPEGRAAELDEAFLRTEAELTEIDAELAAIHSSLSIDSIAREVRGRVRLGDLDLVAAAKGILGAHAKAGKVHNPPAYIAKSLVADPHRWVKHEPFSREDATQAEQGLSPQERVRAERDSCARDEHDWGPVWLQEFDRGDCVRAFCGVARRTIDADYAELEAREFDPQPRIQGVS